MLRNLVLVSLVNILFFIIACCGFSDSLEIRPKRRNWTNWTGYATCKIDSLFTPATEDELIHLVQRAYQLGKKIKVIGAGHSLNTIALPEKGQWALSLENYASILEVDISKKTIRVQGGATLKQIIETLHQYGLTLENLSSSLQPTIGGAIQTGSHGSGIAFGPIHTQIVEMTVINGQGKLTQISPHQSPLLFQAYQCGLGILGIINTVTLRAVPAHLLQERLFADKWPNLLDHLDSLIHENDHFSFVWFPYINRVGVCTANQVDRANEIPKTIAKDSSPIDYLIRAVKNENKTRKVRSLEDIIVLSLKNPSLIPRMNLALFEMEYGKSYSRVDDSHRILSAKCPKRSTTYSAEGAIPFLSTKPFLLELQELIEKNHYPAHQVISVRFVKSDRALLSPTYSGQPEDLFCFVGIFSIVPASHPTLHQAYFSAFEQLIERYHGRMHWGKNGLFNPEYLRQTYPEWSTFLKIREEEDPSGIFLNEFSRSRFLLFRSVAWVPSTGVTS